MRLPLLAAAMMIAAPAAAQTAPTHSVRLAAAPEQGRVVVRDVLWTCAGNSCTGGRSDSRPAIVCQSVARRFGAVDAFAVGDRVFDAAELERCNGAAQR
ncbi:hypothetical protein GGR88_001794 [Sphingomonas jejuensis]|uniref:Uncharacterized protein n=1 Tax=Sphingomonas jejuensis TaxID=904715 RepID=A0ABX0XM58_9SPHN|nr:hypothetical protein [Sphingomonas jejuensis]NJC34320.1 hypothetical protein [Sphingomonas jejuensis]